jgi:hypothetical protein
MNKKLTAIGASLLLATVTLTTFTGCAILSKDASVEQKAAEVQQLCFAAANIGTQVALEEQPEILPQFEIAYANLNSLVESKVVTGLLLRQIVTSLPVKELKSSNARIAIDGATYLYTAFVGEKVNIENNPYVVAAAVGIRDGLKVALNK